MNWKEEIIKYLIECGAELDQQSKSVIKVKAKRIGFFSLGEEKKEELDVYVYEDQYRRKPAQLLSRLRSLCGLNEFRIHGRATSVQLVDKKIATKFLNQNHLMGFGGGKYFLGLFHKDQLVALAVFSKIRFMKYENPSYYSTELERYCSLENTTVVGGLDKLIRHFLRQYETDDLITYIDKEWSDGSAYLRLGFDLVNTTTPLSFSVSTETYERQVVSDKNSIPKEYILIKNKGNLKLRLLV